MAYNTYSEKQLDELIDITTKTPVLRREIVFFLRDKFLEVGSSEQSKTVNSCALSTIIITILLCCGSAVEETMRHS